MINVSKNTEKSQGAAPILCQAINPIVFHPDTTAFSPRVLLRRYEWPALPAHANTAHVAPSLTETVTPNPTTPAAVGSV